MRNPEDTRTDDVDKFLSEVKVVEDRRQALIGDLLKQKEAAIKAFDEKLAKLGYQANSSKLKRNHHKKAETQAKPTGKV
jgi:folate-binding Fe-S cluster repair protein YgfZ